MGKPKNISRELETEGNDMGSVGRVLQEVAANWQAWHALLEDLCLSLCVWGGGGGGGVEKAEEE